MLEYRFLGRIHRILAIGLLLALTTEAVLADSDLPEAAGVPSAKIELADGSVILGEVLDISDGRVWVATEFMGDVDMPLSAISRLQSDQSIDLLTTDKESLALSSLRVVNGEVVLDNDHRLSIDEVDVANPEEWETGKGYHITGRVTSAFEFNRGNTDTDQLNLDLETILESRRDRITVRADYEDTSSIVEVLDDSGAAVSQSQPTADNWQVVGKYDYFLEDPRNYLGVNLGFSHDQFADIDRRSYIGPYFGRKLLTREDLKFDAELGVSYVDTDFLTSEDDSYTGINLNLTGETQLFDGALKLYFRQVNILNLSSMEQSIYRTTVGMRFPLLFGLEAAAEASADYDGGAAEGKDKLDEALKFRVGYTW